MKKYLLLIATAVFILISSCKKNSSTNTSITNSEISDWMHNIVLLHPQASLYDIAVPGSHDAGTYVLNECFGGNTCNTQTQFKNITEQLNAGLRIFDIRPVLYNNKYYTQHATGDYGCKGDLLSNMFTQLRDFLDQHNEFVILEFGHFNNTSYNDPGFSSLINNILGDKLYKENSPDTILFIHKHLSDIIPASSKKGKVMMIYEDATDSPANRANGIFTGVMQPTQGGWSNSHDTVDLKLKQADNYFNYTNSGNSIFQFSWQITQTDVMAINCVLGTDSVSIKTLATQANLQLGSFVDALIASGQIRKGRIPNVIFVDFADEFITRQCILLNKLNLE
ncbi:MAG: hypothetical protein JWN78_3261 [Bacteroidota bacterium]|nr:hypothetical protein [Bacteroidota bacterium]